MDFFFTSDWHIDARTAGSPRRADLEQCAEEVVAAAIANRTEDRSRPRGGWRDTVLVFGGDLADPHRSSSHYAVSVAVRAATKLSANGIYSVWLTGNHDVVQDGTGDHTLLALEAIDDEHIVVMPRPGLVTLPGKEDRDVLCLPYPSTATTYDPEEYLAGCTVEDRPAVVVGHLSLPGMHPGSETSEMPRGREIPWPVARIRELWPDVPVVAAHYHRAQYFEELGVHVIGSLGRLTFADGEHVPGYLRMEL